MLCWFGNRKGGKGEGRAASPLAAEKTDGAQGTARPTMSWFRSTKIVEGEVSTPEDVTEGME